MSQLRFYLDCIPPTATAQQKGERIVKGKNGKSFVSHYKKKPLVQAEELFKGLLLAHRPKTPVSGPVLIECEWVFPWRATEKKGVIREYQRIPKDTIPDSDNSNKLLLDCMTDLGFWKDDSQVYDMHLRKFWGDQPGIFVRIAHGESLPPLSRKVVA